MKTYNEKISMRQLYMIYFVSICSPLIRLLPIQLSRTVRGSIWLSPIIVFAVFMAIVLLINLMFKKHQDKGMSGVIESAFGKWGGKIVLILYFILFVFLASVYVRYFGERLLSSIYVYAPFEFFAAAMLIVAFFVVKASIEGMGRLCEIFSYIFVGIMVILLASSISNIEIFNFTLPSNENFYNHLETIPLITGLMGYCIYAMFLGENVEHKMSIKKHGWKMAIVLALVSLVIILITVGAFGYNVTEKLNLPFFSAIKNIQIFQTIERIESVFLGIWIVTDFVLITGLITVACNILKHLTKAKDTKYISTPIIFIVYFLAIFVASNSFELEKMSTIILTPVNFVFAFIIPILIIIVGKIRKKV